MAKSVNSRKQSLMREMEQVHKKFEDMQKKLETILEEERKERSKTVMDGIEYLIELVPDHEAMCTDDDVSGEGLCTRCTLLKARERDSWNFKDYDIKILLDVKSVVGNVENGVEIKEISKPTKNTKTTKPAKKKTKHTKTELSANQRKAIELGLINDKRVLEVNEDAADLPDEW